MYASVAELASRHPVESALLVKRTEILSLMQWLHKHSDLHDKTGGVHTAQDVLKMLLVGADVTQMASALLVHGPDHVRQVLTDLRAWMDERGVESVRQIKGSMSYRNVRDPSQYERANYMKALKSYR